MTKTKFSTYRFKNSTLDREKVRQAIIEVYGDYLNSDDEDNKESNEIRDSANKVSKSIKKEKDNLAA